MFHFSGDISHSSGFYATITIAIAILSAFGFDILRAYKGPSKFRAWIPESYILMLLLYLVFPFATKSLDGPKNSTKDLFADNSSRSYPRIATSQPVIPARVAEWTKNVAEFSSLNEPALRLLNLRYATVQPDQPQPAAPWKPIFPTTQPTSQPSTPIVYENPDAMPPYWLCKSAVWSIAPELVYPRIRKMDFNPQQIALLDRRMESIYLEPMSETPGLIRTASGTNSRAKIELLDESPGRYHFNVQNAAGWLIISQAYMPGWHAKMSFAERRRPSRRSFDRYPTNGFGTEHVAERDAIVAPAYGALIAVPLQSSFGQDLDVVITYFPAGLKYGLVTSALGGVMLLILICAAVSSATSPANRL